MDSKKRYPQRAANRSDILEAIASGKLRVDTASGQAFSLDQGHRMRALKLEPVSGPHQRSRPYFRFGFIFRGERLRCLIHRAVWWAAGRDIPPNFEINHKDGDKALNGVDNLELATSSINNTHAVATGLMVPRRGFRGTKAKLSDDAVRDIRQSSETQALLAKRYGVSAPQISKVRAGKIYRHVTSS